ARGRTRERTFMDRESRALGRTRGNARGPLPGHSVPLPGLEADPDRHRRAATVALLGLGGTDGLSDLPPHLPRRLHSPRHGMARVSPRALGNGSPMEEGPSGTGARLDSRHDRAREWNAE